MTCPRLGRAPLGQDFKTRRRLDTLQATKTSGLQASRPKMHSGPATEYFAAKQSVPNMDGAFVSASPTMPTATLCNLPLSTMFDRNLEKSLSSLEWVLTSGPCCHFCFWAPLTSVSRRRDRHCLLSPSRAVASFLLFDFILGCDWLYFCGDS
jgi:hypothetical protein